MNKYRLFLWMVILALLAGLVNAVAVFGYAGTTVSHVTGLISKFSVSLSSGDASACPDLLALIFSFFFGAVTAGFATGERTFRMEKIYGFIIITIGLLIPLPLVLDARHSVFLLAFLMGLQNGMVVTFKGILVRLTHMTGNLTDLGVYIGYKIRGNKEERPISGLVPFATITGFCLGGTAGILIYNQVGLRVLIIASAVYIVLGIVFFHLQRTCIDRDFNGIPDDQETK